MDALPMQEQNTHAYVSRVAGVMHACGHDGNIAMALGAAFLLAQRRREFTGTIKLVFQPCEEKAPGGAKAMLAAHVLESPRVDAMLAGHVDTSLPLGTIGLKSGAMMAAADAFALTIQGQGGHGALPHKSVDAIAIAGQVISGLQQIISRERDPLEPAVLTIGTISGGSAYNIIADSVHMQGTIRTLNDQERKRIPQKVERVAKNIARAFGGSVNFKFEPGHPALYNHPHITQLVVQAGRQWLGARRVKILEQPVMSGEDFTYFARAVPACYFRVGVGGQEKKYQYPWHHPKFDFDERGLAVGATVLAGVAMEFLR
jgi:amidohydrolase